MAKSNNKTTTGKAKAHKKQKLSAYEQKRLDRIKRNEERFKSLGIDDAKKQVRKAARGMLMYNIIMLILSLVLLISNHIKTHI